MHFETAPAKINLTLDTLYKRKDGYHEVNMVMTTVDLNDQLAFEKRNDRKIIIHTEHRHVPVDKRNLAYQAAELLFREYGIEAGVTITIDKNIPIAAGLAGGSADAAATLRGINELYGLNIDIDTLAHLASHLGSDIPFCVYGGTALATGRGEHIEPLPKPPKGWVVLAKPKTKVSTKTIYQALKPGKNAPVSAAMAEAIRVGDHEKMMSLMKNDLQEVTVKNYPEVSKLIETMQRNGAEGAMMSGSGPTVFGLVQKERQAVHLYNAIKGCCNEVYKVRLLG